MALVEEQGAGAADDPEALLNEWLGELTVLTAVSNNIASPTSSLSTWYLIAMPYLYT